MLNFIAIVAIKKQVTQAEEFDTKCTCIFLNYIAMHAIIIYSFLHNVHKDKCKPA